MKKRFLKSKPVCKVTFRLPRKMVKDASHVHLVGEFNHWNILATPMKKLKNGDFTIVSHCSFAFGFSQAAKYNWYKAQIIYTLNSKPSI